MKTPDGHMEIYVMNGNGSGVMRLSDDPAHIGPRLGRHDRVHSRGF